MNIRINHRLRPFALQLNFFYCCVCTFKVKSTPTIWWINSFDKQIILLDKSNHQYMIWTELTYLKKSVYYYPICILNLLWLVCKCGNDVYNVILILLDHWIFFWILVGKFLLRSILGSIVEQRMFTQYAFFIKTCSTKHSDLNWWFMCWKLFAISYFYRLTIKISVYTFYGIS